MLKFQGKTALITGSGTGIGQAIAKKFAENGANIIILGRRREPLQDTAAILEQIIRDVKSNASVQIFANVDVSDESAMSAMFDKLKQDNTRVNYMINNAGVSGPVTCFPNADLSEFKSTIGIHLTGTFWGSVQALRVMERGDKIITISTFFTEERPLEQRPYRFRSPYTAAQGAKNRLAEAMSWELVDRGVVSIATNPGPVHSDRIYKTVYPKAAAEFMRVSGFEYLSPSTVEKASKQLLELLGEDEQVISRGISEITKDLGGEYEQTKFAETLQNLLAKIQTIAAKIQKNTSHMIANREFLSQDQVAESILNLCDEEIATILNGKVIPGDRVFYPVKPHVGTIPTSRKPELGGDLIVLVVDPTDMSDVYRVVELATHIKECGGEIVFFVSKLAPDEARAYISERFHCHEVDTGDPKEMQRWLNTASTKIGKIRCVIYDTGKMPDIASITSQSRAEWDRLVEKFITKPATLLQSALEQFVPGGGIDPRLYKETTGRVLIIGPELPAGKVTGTRRAQIEIFRGAIRPFTTTINQELSDVLGSKIRVFTLLQGSVTGAEIDNKRVAAAFDYIVSDRSTNSSEVILVDESR